MARPYKQVKDILAEGGYHYFCKKWGRRSMKKTLLLFESCYYCDEGNAKAVLPTKDRRYKFSKTGKKSIKKKK